MSAINQSTIREETSENGVNDKKLQQSEENEARATLLPESKDHKINNISSTETGGGESQRTRKTTGPINNASHSPKLVPPDGGWGWLVAAGGFINIHSLLLHPGRIRSNNNNHRMDHQHPLVLVEHGWALHHAPRDGIRLEKSGWRGSSVDVPFLDHFCLYALR